MAILQKNPASKPANLSFAIIAVPPEIRARHSLLTNDEVLAVDQDALVKQGVNVSRQGQLEVYRKELEDGSLAVGLFNRGPSEASVTALWSDLKVAGKQTVRDLWRQKNVGVYDQSFRADVASHGVVLVRVIPSK